MADRRGQGGKGRREGTDKKRHGEQKRDAREEKEEFERERRMDKRKGIEMGQGGHLQKEHIHRTHAPHAA